tara:strand:+ start:312 stop:737 length:426 start_codon:yes stop_codon:yes gene_type:complete
MIKIQKKDFNIEEEINLIKSKYSNIGAVNSFVGFVRDFNEGQDVKFIELEVYEKMAVAELSKIQKKASDKWKLIDCLIIHRYGKLMVSDKIVLVACFSEHRNQSFEACKFIMDYLKRDAPFWKKETYSLESKWLENATQIE